MSNVGYSHLCQATVTLRDGSLQVANVNWVLQNTKRQLQTAMIVEARVRPQKSGLTIGQPSEFDSDSLSDEADQPIPGQASDDDDLFMDCEPTPSTNLDAMERTADIASTR